MSQLPWATQDGTVKAMVAYLHNHQIVLHSACPQLKNVVILPKKLYRWGSWINKTYQTFCTSPHYKEKEALVGLLHPYISTVTHIFNHHTPTPELSSTPSTVTPSTITPWPYSLTYHYTLYLMVESCDPVTMTLSSYCRHSTEPVWPTSSVVTLRDLRSQICSEWRVRSCHNIIPMITTCKSTP